MTRFFTHLGGPWGPEASAEKRMHILTSSSKRHFRTTPVGEANLLKPAFLVQVCCEQIEVRWAPCLEDVIQSGLV